MDLSTGDNIYASWINRNGLDNCGSKLVPRIVPGDPDGSFVMRKITGALACVGSHSQAMPPPPQAPLTAAEIDTVRYWILFGAPKSCGDGKNISAGGQGGASGGAGDSGATSVAGGGAQSGGADGTAGTSSTGGTTGDDPFKCTASQACTGQLLCAGPNCSTMPWDCVSHLDMPPGFLAHPCPTETMEFCGCDGVTFEAPPTCPDRPYQHAGSCGDGYNCNASNVGCTDAVPTCPPGQAASIVNDCFAECVSTLDCRCEYNWQCPTGYQCNRDNWHCIPLPPPDGGM
jgi:hypothetical protein